MPKTFLTASVVAISLSMPAAADPTVGVGLTFAFGGGAVDTGIGLRVFSDDEAESFVASVGVDYMFQSNRIRPTIGAAYLENNYYVGLDMGFDLNGGGIDFGVGIGGVDADDKPTRRAATDTGEEGGGGEEGGDGDVIIDGGGDSPVIND